MSLEKAKEAMKLWADDELKNIRFSGGEPTLYKGLPELIEYANRLGIERIAISTNGSADIDYYYGLLDAGLSDISISLDACCSSFADRMAGIACGFNKVVDNIRELSKLTYVTVGVVLTEQNVMELNNIIEFADSLGVSDIRIISAAQYNKLLIGAKSVPPYIMDKYPILKYRINNILEGRNVRGIKDGDTKRCYFPLDDSVIAGQYHFPCVIYMREGGNPIGFVGKEMRKEREGWVKNHNTHNDEICRKNCLDVCIDHNNKVAECII